MYNLLLIEWSLVRIQPGEPKEIKRLLDFFGGRLEALFSRCFFKRYTFRFWFSTEALGTEPNRDVEDYVSGRQTKRAPPCIAPF
jgi:hypothetical protein